MDIPLAFGLGAMGPSGLFVLIDGSSACGGGGLLMRCKSCGGLVSVMWDNYWGEAPAKEKVVGETSTWVVENNIM